MEKKLEIVAVLSPEAFEAPREHRVFVHISGQHKFNALDTKRDCGRTVRNPALMGRLTRIIQSRRVSRLAQHGGSSAFPEGVHFPSFGKAENEDSLNQKRHPSDSEFGGYVGKDGTGGRGHPLEEEKNGESHTKRIQENNTASRGLVEGGGRCRKLVPNR